VPHVVSPLTGAARVQGAAAWFDARTAAVHPGGDHVIVVGTVLDAREGGGAGALVHLRGGLRPLT